MRRIRMSGATEEKPARSLRRSTLGQLDPFFTHPHRLQQRKDERRVVQYYVRRGGSVQLSIKHGGGVSDPELSRDFGRHDSLDDRVFEIISETVD